MRVARQLLNQGRAESAAEHRGREVRRANRTAQHALCGEGHTAGEARGGARPSLRHRVGKTGRSRHAHYAGKGGLRRRARGGCRGALRSRHCVCWAAAGDLENRSGTLARNEINATAVRAASGHAAALPSSVMNSRRWQASTLNCTPGSR